MGQRRAGLVDLSKERPPDPGPYACCECKTTFLTLSALETHTDNTCTHKRGSAAKLKHDGLVKLLYEDVSKVGGMNAKLEPRYYNDEKRWVDLAVFPSASTTSPLQLDTDLAVTNPLAPSYVEDTIRDVYAAIEKRETEKINKHAEGCKQAGAEFIPFVMSTFGGFGTQAQIFMRNIGQQAAFFMPSIYTPQAYALRIKAILHFAVHRWNYINWRHQLRQSNLLHPYRLPNHKRRAIRLASAFPYRESRRFE